MSKSIGRRVRNLRAAKGLTQYELSRRAGVREVRISEIERGLTSRANTTSLPRVAEALGVSLRELTREEPVDVRVVGSEAQPMTLHATHVTVVHVTEPARRGSTYAEVR